MNGISLYEVIDLIPRVGLFMTPVGVAITAYVVCEVLRIETKTQWIITGIAFATALLIVLAIYLFRRIFRRKRGGKLEEGLAGSEGDTAALRAQWKDSIQKLKGTAVGGGGARALAALPWFVIIGAPASGKSTLLRQSGIDFPVGDAAIRGLQGTRNCDWWFSNVGVFLDTAGRYISDASAAEWAQFLELVRKHRTGAPIHGVIVALPAPDLIARSEAARDLDARRIRARLDELIDHLGVNFPVWVVLTKVDLIGGFAEFFGHVDAVTRAQIVGWTAEQGEGGRFDQVAFAKRFQGLIHRLREMRPALLATAPLRGRPAAFSFPDEFGAIEEPLGRMLQRIFEPNVYQETPLFRGLYVTSATQQGSPLQRAASRVRELLGAPQVDADASGSVVKHAYFVKDLMHERIVADQDMTWTTQRELERGKNKRVGINLMGASAGVLLFLTIMAFGLYASRELESVEAEIAKLELDRGGAVSRAVALRTAALMASADNLRNIGLSQQRSLREDAGELQERVYQEQVLEPLLKGWAEELRALDTSGDLTALVASYEDFLTVHAMLDRAIDQQATPPQTDDGTGDGAEDGDEGGGGDEGDDGAEAPGAEAADAVPGSGPPAGYFTDAEREALRRHRAMLRRKGIVPRKGDHVDTLLGVIWHNHGCAAWFEDEGLRLADIRAGREPAIKVSERPTECAEWAVPLVADVHAAFREAAGRYVQSASTAIQRVKSDASARQTYVDERLERFANACASVRDRLTSGAYTREDLGLYVAHLADVAAGKGSPAPAATGSDGTGADTAQPSANPLLDSVDGAVESLRRLAARADAADALGGVDGLERSLDGFAQLSGWNEGGASDTAEVQEALGHLRQVAEALAQTRRDWETGAMVPFQSPTSPARTLPEAVKLLEKAELDDADLWRAKVRPHLVALARPPVSAEQYERDPVRWGLGVELVRPALLRDALCQRFLSDSQLVPGSYRQLANTWVALFRKEPTRLVREEMGAALQALLYPHDRDQRLFPLTAETQAESRALAAQSFEKIVALASDYWASRRNAVSVYGNAEPWAYIDRWIGAESKMLKVRADLATQWGDWSLPPELESSVAAAEIWAGDAASGGRGVKSLQQENAFFGPEFDDRAVRLGKLHALRNAQASSPDGLRALSSGLGVPDRVPAWAELTTESSSDESRLADLRRAVSDAENQLVDRVGDHFDRRWRKVRDAMVVALQTAEESRLSEAKEQFEALLEELRGMFGEHLDYRPGKRLVVSAAFPTSWSEVRSTSFVPRPFTVYLGVALVPTVDGYPLIRIEYSEVGSSEPAIATWAPNAKDELAVRWTPNTGATFAISMVSDDGKTLPFASWDGEQALVEALKAGGGTSALGSGRLAWTGSGAAAKSQAVFTLRTTDRSVLSSMLAPPSGDASSRLPEKCLERIERP